jgi:hypothetical protein
MSTVELDRSVDPTHRLIFNCDGYGVFKDANDDLARWIYNIFAPLDDTHVDTIFWCDGSGGNTAYYDSQVLELTGERTGQVPAFLRRLIREGNDPPKLVVREAKRRGLSVFYSLRLNDVHDDFIPEELPSFKVRHPEWLIGSGHPYGGRTALNFAMPEVRQLKLNVIREIATKYDFDGIEIDLMRSPPYFVPGSELQNAGYLTDLLRDVRQLLQARGQERGRPFHLAVRVDENLEACRLDGFDVPAWISEHLMDMVILGSGAIDIEIEPVKELAHGAGIQVYPCLYGWPSRYTPIPSELARGLALNYWHQGADGIYLFNWFPHEINKRYQIPLLSELDDLRALREKDLLFAVDRGMPQREYPHNWMRAVLPTALQLGKQCQAPLFVGQDLHAIPEAHPELRVIAEKLSDAGILHVTLNGIPLSPGRRDEWQLVIPVEPQQVKQGMNQVGLVLESGQMAVTALELYVCGIAPQR